MGSFPTKRHSFVGSAIEVIQLYGRMEIYRIVGSDTVLCSRVFKVLCDRYSTIYIVIQSYRRMQDYSIVGTDCVLNAGTINCIYAVSSNSINKKIEK